MTTKAQDFRVVEFDGELVWLKSLEGSKRGLQFGVASTESQRKYLNKGDRITVTLKSLNERNTAWEIQKIHRNDISPE